MILFNIRKIINYFKKEESFFASNSNGGMFYLVFLMHLPNSSSRAIKGTEGSADEMVEGC
jgi:hypothetical protein